ncbi:glycosyltransferase [Aridibaculum aurantiacum]|uniref:glycosyltransferase n=1 Tax=Aridibaculum aurantiacum TaxID=2810307 RepID=UPI001A9662DD|nr:glycosyltransferase [Aridibaculum aurantiacum]
MKIAITADPEIPVPPKLYGGIERIIHQLCKELVTLGHEVTLFAHRESNVPCRLVKYTGTDQSKSAVLKNGVLITRYVFKEKYDVVHSFGRLAYLSMVLPTRVRKVMSYQREPTISQIKLATKLSRKHSLLFTGCSDYIAKQIRPFAPSYCVHNFVDTDFYTPIYEVANDAPLVFLGRLEQIKGAHIAIEVAKKAGKKLVIAGNIPPEAQHYFNEQVQPHIDDKQITYIGPVNDEQKNRMLGKASAFLMPILWNEPFGIVMAEALACGTPVIGFSRGSVPEVVLDGVNGYRCSSIDDMVHAVSQVKNISRSSVREDAEKRFSSKIITDAYLSVYQS